MLFSSSFPQGLIRFGIVLMLLLVGGPLMSFILHWRLTHSDKYSTSDLEAAGAYIASLPASAAPYRFSGNGRVVRLIGDAAGIQSIGNALWDDRAGYYYNSLNKSADIELVAAPGILSPSPDRRTDALHGLSVTKGAGASIMAYSGKDSGCAIVKRIEYGWLQQGYVLVDPTRALDPAACTVVGFDVLAGFPTVDASFNYLEVPAKSVRRLILDFVEDCSNRGRSDIKPIQRNGWGVSRPSLSCVAEMISEALMQKPKPEVT
jgi:hypothetical protein